MKIHFDGEAYHGRSRTACGASAQRTREHAKVTCAQCLCTKAFKSGPRVSILGAVVPSAELSAMREALSFYATVAHYVVGPNNEESDVAEDSGTIARAALKGSISE